MFISDSRVCIFSNLEYLGTLAIFFEFIYSDSIGNQRGESPNYSLLIHLQLGKEFRFDRDQEVSKFVFELSCSYRSDKVVMYFSSRQFFQKNE